MALFDGFRIEFFGVENNIFPSTVILIPSARSPLQSEIERRWLRNKNVLDLMLLRRSGKKLKVNFQLSEKKYVHSSFVLPNFTQIKATYLLTIPPATSMSSVEQSTKNEKKIEHDIIYTFYGKTIVAVNCLGLWEACSK